MVPHLYSMLPEKHDHSSPENYADAGVSPALPPGSAHITTQWSMWTVESYTVLREWCTLHLKDLKKKQNKKKNMQCASFLNNIRLYAFILKTTFPMLEGRLCF